MRLTSNCRIGLVAAGVYVADQLTKHAVMRLLDYSDQRVVVDGFFKFVHWGNTGAAWSLFYGNNGVLAMVSLLALAVLLWSKDRFDASKPVGWIALGLIVGGIVGNLTDRLRFGHVVDFIRFYLYQRGGTEVGFPAFNLADSAICVGVGLLFLLSWSADDRAAAASRTSSAA